MISMKIQGGQQLAKILAGLDPAKQRGVLAKMLTAAAEPIRSRMAELAPMEAGKPDLKDHIVISSASKIQSPEAIGTRSREEGEAAVAVGPQKEFFYGLYQEFGTVRHSAQAFARPAFDERHLAALKVFQEEIWAHLRAKSETSTTGRGL